MNTEKITYYIQHPEFIELEETKIVLRESEAHIGDAYVVRMFAKKLGN